MIYVKLVFEARAPLYHDTALRERYTIAMGSKHADALETH